MKYTKDNLFVDKVLKDLEINQDIKSAGFDEDSLLLSVFTRELQRSLNEITTFKDLLRSYNYQQISQEKIAKITKILSNVTLEANSKTAIGSIYYNFLLNKNKFYFKNLLFVEVFNVY